MLVMKFGGTSMGSAARMKVAAQICAGQKAERPTVAVVSAMSKVTDLLLETLRHAEGGDRDGVRRGVETLTARHFEVCKDLLSSRAAE